MICSKCHVLCKDLCPKCGTALHLQQVSENEPVLLIVLTAMQAILVEPILADSGIPYFKKGLYGGALTAQFGSMREVFSYYVSYADYDKCRSLLEDVFGEDEALMQLLHEFDIEE